MLTRRELRGIALMAAIAAITVYAADDLRSRVLVGLAFAVGEVGLLGCRRGPLPLRTGALVMAFLCGLAATLLEPNAFGELPSLVAASLLPYAVAERARMPMIVAMSVAFGVVIAVVVHNPGGALAGIGIWFFAERTQEQMTAGVERDRAVALLAEVQAARDEQTHAAAAEERARIARDLHDVLAHSLAGLSLQLQGLRAVALRVGVGVELTGPLDRAAELARDGLTEARAAVAALHTADGLGVDRLPSMIERFPADVTVVVEGTSSPLAEDVDTAVYRAVQESLTNVARYATGAAVTVSLQWTVRELSVSVVDSGVRKGSQVSGITGTGKGLSGMRHRIEEVGGTMTAGSHGEGWSVRFTVPVRSR